MSTCRICGKHISGGSGEIKYSTRHYAHDLCFLWVKGPKGLLKLNPFQLGKFRLSALNTSGIRKEFEHIYNEKLRSQQNAKIQ